MMMTHQEMRKRSGVCHSKSRPTAGTTVQMRAYVADLDIRQLLDQTWYRIHTVERTDDRGTTVCKSLVVFRL